MLYRHVVDIIQIMEGITNNLQLIIVNTSPQELNTYRLIADALNSEVSVRVGTNNRLHNIIVLGVSYAYVDPDSPEYDEIQFYGFDENNDFTGNIPEPNSITASDTVTEL